MSKVNVVRPDGSVVSVDEDVAKTATSAGTSVHAELPEEAQSREAADLQHESYGGAEGAIGAAGGGALDTLTFGGYGKLMDAAGVGDAFRGDAQEHPTARTAGELAAFVAPSGLLGGAAKAGSELTGLGLAAKAGEAVGGIGGRALEGGLLGTGGYVASTNVTGDPLTIEGAIEGAGIGAILNVGAGAIADRLEGATWNAKRAAAEENVFKDDLGIAQNAKKIFGDTPPSWNEFVEAHTAAQDAIKEFNAGVTKDTVRYAKFADSNSKLTDAITRAQDVVNDVRNRYASEAQQAQWIEGKPRSAMVGYSKEGEAANILVNAKPPISPELKARLDEYSSRISRILKMKGGGNRLDVNGKWMKDASVAANPRGAMEELRALQGDLMSGEKGFPMASGKLRDLPPLPGQLKPVATVELPKTIEAFSRKHAPAIAELAQSVQDPATAAAFERLTNDLGLKVKSTIADTIASTHKTLGDYGTVLRKLQSDNEALAAKEASKPMLLKLLNKAVRYGGARALDVGGMTGAVARTLGGEAIWRAMNGVEDAAFGGALLQSKASVTSRLRGLVAKYGLPAADTARALGPVTGYLQSSFPSGAKDPEKDHRKLAVHRTHEILSAAQTAPDTAFMAVQGLMGHPDDVGFKLHQHVVGTMQYLASTVPRDPGTDTTMFGSNWTPQWHDTISLAHRLEAVQNPLASIVRTLAGDGHPAATEALWAVYPAIMNEFSQEIAMAASTLKGLTYEQGSQYSQLFRTPMTGLQEPAVVLAIQGLYLPKQQPGGAGGQASASGPNGRPPAVQSSVAGSSVSGLIS